MSSPLDIGGLERTFITLMFLRDSRRHQALQGLEVKYVKLA
jgi:hypothetical protein